MAEEVEINKEKLNFRIEELTFENNSLMEKLENSNGDRTELDNLEKDLLRWQKLYEDLHAKVEPFMDQLDAFEAEKQALLGRNQNVEAEIEKMSKEYARLLGHQNQKQKIHHIIKIKDENNALKKEVSTYREQSAKQKRTIQKLEEKISALEGKKRFDSSKAFSHYKENTAPLKDETYKPVPDYFESDRS
ncbi:hypothetical protein KUTeg_021631 [Tegillarca granosa]|uniref:Hyaluronan-mediated motility receptor C-terminal domain-containing protein n=1 Tax=Tegillarca granosa TaxID=220873 RepID=A0ABQ9E4A9_TEGGR|nr:hypothetical protein KUTeg_021631 [Tegillarca granosa]